VERIANSPTKAEIEDWQKQHIRQGLAELEAGKSVSNDCVLEWLERWGTENELSPPK
jgi:predicted transcriptional regulator